MKEVTLKFNIQSQDDEVEMLLSLSATSIASAVRSLDCYLRKEVNYNELLSDEYQEALSFIRGKLREYLEEEGVPLDLIFG